MANNRNFLLGLDNLTGGWPYNRTARYVAGFHEKEDMQPINNREASNWLTSVLTDLHFWVPVAVLIGGLLLLEYIH